MKKGAFFTLGIMIVVILLFALTSLIYKNSLESKNRVADMGVLDRVFDIDHSIQKSLRRIFIIDSGLDISITNYSISFLEPLPPNTQDEVFKSDNARFKTYVENANRDNPKITINNTKFAENLTLHLKPHNIIYTHPEGFGNEEIDIVPEEVNMKGYNFTINVTEIILNPAFTWDIINECTLGDEGCIKFNILVTSTLDLSESDSKNLNATQDNQLTIHLTSGDVVITINNPAKVNIDNGANPFIIESVIDLKKIDDNRVEVYYPENIITTELEELNLVKKSAALIAAQNVTI